ncbi:glyoxylate/succinic semialdehyde reductase 2, chloroplastic-like [Rhododendron vialii]|uniref:glyoxylate/succinic semialdehyde reductase 2, chloroplastic-like n=1 Tax=Rhododendron vialii TaxID=182163 RepID=UPI00265FA328|nr:glyoxylate/succinic semialdehyde reductase 2, chloroplastic-like [Rhododendron vialii]
MDRPFSHLFPSKGVFGYSWYVDISTVDGSSSKFIGRQIKATRALFLQVNRYDISVLAIQLCFYSAKLLYIDFSCRHQFQSSKKLAIFKAGRRWPADTSDRSALMQMQVFYASCDKTLFDTVAPLLNIAGKSRYFLGDLGNGAAMKHLLST